MGETKPTPTAEVTDLLGSAGRAHGVWRACKPRLTFVVTWLFFALSARTARAERDVVRLAGKSVAFEWHAPPECPSRAAVLERVERLVGHTAQPASAIDAAIQARVERVDSGEWQLGFDSSGGTAAERRVLGRSCEEVADAAALLVALLVDPLIASRTVDATVVPTDSAPAPIAETRLEQPAPERAPAHTPTPASGSRDEIAAPAATSNARRSPSVDLAAEFAVVAGPLPRVAPGASVAVGLRLQRLRLAARLAYFAEQHADVPGSSDSADLRFGSGGLLLAYRALRGSVELAPFVAVDLGWMHGHRSADPDLEGSVLLVGVGPGLLSNYSISRHVFLQARVQTQVLAARPGFVVGSDLVHRPGAASLELGFGALWVTDPRR